MRRTMTGLVAAASILLIAACGSSENKQGRASAETTPGAAANDGKPGGTLTVLSAGDVDYVDPGQTYYAFGWAIAYAVNRTLYSVPPGDHATPVPDLATAAPEISADLKTVTVHLKPGVRYAPPLRREVTAKDVKYAFERAFSANVPNGYAGAYFSDIVGFPAKPGPIRDVPGIETPDDQTLVLRLRRRSAATVAAALVLPITMPVPREYAREFDAHSPSTYDSHVAFTGPYMVVHDASGKLTGRKTGRSIDLVRNPSWNPKTDYRPAYLDAIHVDEGNTDATVASRRAVNGSHVVTGDGAPPAAEIKRLLQRTPDQIVLIPGGSNRYITLNTTIKPLDDVNVRRAIAAVVDRTALRLTRGGASVGDIATHFLPPGMPGFEAAGGMKGPPYDFLRNPDGDLELAKEYMRKAGYPSGRYTGKAELLMVAANVDPAKTTAQRVEQDMAKLGLKIRFRVAAQDAIYTTFCGTPSSRVAICPNIGWQRDFPDGQSMLDAPFGAKHISKQNNTNMSQLDDPAINAAIDRAERTPAGPARDRAWGRIDAMITGTAAAIPWIWDRTPLVRSRDVHGATNSYTTVWDLSFSSLE